ncbi:2-polyprenyl-6-methoxyphenol hydroxylase-like FAD-dependent oxidoreductase [Bradyrhizobium sp. LB1.3]|uniref:FAD-binding domain n=1 Tax=unclassified Bradyrhizobium TaxID=2631580 RepID=UPI003391FE5A
MKNVLISGIGIAGPTLAYWLRAAGFEPTLVEHAPALRGGGYVIDFWGLGYTIAERMGLLPEINRDGYHVQELRIVDEAGHRLAGFGTRVFAELTNGRYATVQRSHLSRLLFERSNGCAESIFGDEIILVEEKADCVEVQLKHGGRRRCDLLIGADGLHSAVRKLVFGPQARFERHLGYVVAAFEARGYRPRNEDVYLIYGQPGRMVGRFTLRDNRTLFLLVFAADSAILPETPGSQKALLRKVYGGDGWECEHMLTELERTGELYFDAVSQIRMPNWSRGRVALIGDAACCVSLLAGQGSALAMTSAYVLAGELAAADGRYPEAFARYEALLRSYIDRKQRGAERFAGALAPRTRSGMLFRNLVIRSFSIPGLARLAIGRDIADELELPDYR